MNITQAKKLAKNKRKKYFNQIDSVGWTFSIVEFADRTFQLEYHHSFDGSIGARVIIFVGYYHNVLCSAVWKERKGRKTKIYEKTKKL